jgi:hypothetical protein
VNQRNTHHASWRQLLEAPPPASHIVQLYESDEFLARAVALFAAEGLRRGEAVLLTGTQPHLASIRGALAAFGAEPEAALRYGQLTLSDAESAVDTALAAGMPDAARFHAAAGEAIARVNADARFTGVRWWGEMSNLAQLRGNRCGGEAMEVLADEIAKQHGIRLFCSYLCDRFDPRAYDSNLRDLCTRHSHVIPAEDYVRHRIAVDRAIADVIGAIRGPLLQSLLSWNGLACDLPSSQAVLFWLRETLPGDFDAVLTRARAYE